MSLTGRLRRLRHAVRPRQCPHGWFYPPARTAQCSVCPRIDADPFAGLPIVPRDRPLPDRVVGTVVVTGAALGAALFVGGLAVLEQAVARTRNAWARHRGY